MPIQINDTKPEPSSKAIENTRPFPPTPSTVKHQVDETAYLDPRECRDLSINLGNISQNITGEICTFIPAEDIVSLGLSNKKLREIANDALFKKLKKIGIKGNNVRSCVSNLNTFKSRAKSFTIRNDEILARIEKANNPPASKKSLSSFTCLQHMPLPNLHDTGYEGLVLSTLKSDNLIETYKNIFSTNFGEIDLGLDLYRGPLRVKVCPAQYKNELLNQLDEIKSNDQLSNNLLNYFSNRINQIIAHTEQASSTGKQHMIAYYIPKSESENSIYALVCQNLEKSILDNFGVYLNSPEDGSKDKILAAVRLKDTNLLLNVHKATLRKYSIGSTEQINQFVSDKLQHIKSI